MKRIFVGLLVALCLAAISERNTVNSIGLNLPISAITFIQQKLARSHYAGNYNGGAQGMLEQSDYEAIGDCTLALPGYNKYTYEQLHNDFAVRAFNAFPGQPLNKEMLLKIASAFISADPTLVSSVTSLAGIMFDVWNYENGGSDNAMSLTELKASFQCMKIDPSTADQAFPALDLNKDGSISKTEYITSAVLFHTCIDPNDPSKYFYGELPPY